MARLEAENGSRIGFLDGAYMVFLLGFFGISINGGSINLGISFLVFLLMGHMEILAGFVVPHLPGEGC